MFVSSGSQYLVELLIGSQYQFSFEPLIGSQYQFSFEPLIGSVQFGQLPNISFVSKFGVVTL